MNILCDTLAASKIYSDRIRLSVPSSSHAAFNRRLVQCASPSGLHRLSYVEWGARDNPRVLVCVHGLTRCARDFDYLARALCRDYRVICPDIPGRGESDWLRNPMEYSVPVYVADMVTLIARLDVPSVDWLGTSMGGLIGLALASLPDSPVARLVLNDAGPHITAVSLDRIGEYVGKAPTLPSLAAAEMLVRAVSAPFGAHTDEEWRFLTEHVVKTMPDGVAFRYDPAIAVAFNAEVPHKDIDLWPMYDRIRCPTLVLRGAESDLLTAATARAMTERGPKARLVEFAGVGHAPTLIHDDQIAAVREFLG
jgi:pimeloyl-ACP methyl ester carboxylesterase